MATINGTFNSLIAGTLSGTVATPGAPGVGVPAGGSAGQVLAKVDGVSYNTEWVNVTASAAWGTITGTLSAQSDLQSALDAKQSVSGMSAYLSKAGNLAGLTDLSVSRDNLNLGTLNTPVFAGVTAQGSGANVANLTPTSLTLTHATAGQFTIQPSQGIVFPDATIQTTAYPGPAGATAWGTITGTLSSQTDLQTALDGKYSTSNPSGYITSSALTGYATESWVTAGFYPLTGNPSGFITSSALTPYLTSATAASTYQTIAGMSSYLTTSAAASTYYPLTGNPSGFITSSALTGYATESWVTSQGYLTDAPSDSNQYVRLNGAWSALSVPADYITSVTSPLSVTSGDLSIDLTGYATESYVTSQGYITSSALSPYLTSATAASTYQTISGMNSYAPLASPALTGNPTAPTPATGDDDTSIATTAFVKAQGYLTTAPVTSVAGKTGAVTLVVGDVSGAAPLASPALTGTPTAPTATLGTNTTQIATTAFVLANAPSTSFATDAQALALTSNTVSISPLTLQRVIMHPSFRRITSMAGNSVSTTSGTGSSNYVASNWIENIGPSSGSTGSAMVTPSNVAGYDMIGRLSEANIDFSKRIILCGKFGQAAASGYLGDANNFWMFSLGKASAYAGNFTGKAIGIRKFGSTANFFLVVHNGTTLTAVDSGVSNNSFSATTDFTIISDGSGNVTLFINDSQVATTSAGPTGSVTNGNRVYAEVNQVGTFGARIAAHTSNIGIYVAP